MMKYDIGQILYVVLTKQANVYPLQVVEIVTKKTVVGEETTYMVQTSSSSDTKPVSLNDVNGEIFDSAAAVKKALIERVTNLISTRVDQAVANSLEWYKNGFEKASEQLEISQPEGPKPRAKNQSTKVVVPTTIDEEQPAIIELPDGTKARVKSLKLPPDLS